MATCTGCYDGVGNRLMDSADASGGAWQYNANHQLTARPDISYGYDATGKVHYYYNSHLGQPLKLFDKAGRTTWSARSQAFGRTDVVVKNGQPAAFPRAV